MTARVGFVGLGVMGGPMAGHLARAGYPVRVYNRTRSRAAEWLAGFGGELAETPAEAARDAELVFACVGNDDDVRAVTVEPGGAFDTLGEGAVFVDHTTASAQLARELETAAATRGAGFVDAPVSGGQSGAEQGILTVMAGGTPEAFAQARPAMEAYARNIVHLGPAGSGQLAKLVNQVCIAGTLQGLAEGLHLAQRVGLDGEALLAAISGGAAQSWQMDNRATTMLAGEYDFGFAVEWMRKDLGLALDEARRRGARLELTERVRELYAEVEALGGRRWDTSSLLARLESPTPRD